MQGLRCKYEQRKSAGLLQSEGPPIRVDIRHSRPWRCGAGTLLRASFAASGRRVGDSCRIRVRCVGSDHRGCRCRDRARVSSKASTSPCVAGRRNRATAVPGESAQVSDCCAGVGDSGELCPRCARSGPVVGAAPVRPHRGTAATGPWRYCPNLLCPVVFFLHRDVVEVHDVIAQVGDKAQAKPVPVCFCFAHTLADICSDVEAHAGTSAIKAAVKAAVANGLCSCEHLNASGECCLPAVHRAVHESQQHLARGVLGG